MASEPVLSREVGNRTSRVSQPVMVTSAMMLCCYEVLCLLSSEVIEEGQLKLEDKRKISRESGVIIHIIHEGKGRNYIRVERLQTWGSLRALRGPSGWWGMFRVEKIENGESWLVEKLAEENPS